MTIAACFRFGEDISRAIVGNLGIQVDNDEGLDEGTILKPYLATKEVKVVEEEVKEPIASQ